MPEVANYVKGRSSQLTQENLTNGEMDCHTDPTCQCCHPLYGQPPLLPHPSVWTSFMDVYLATRRLQARESDVPDAEDQRGEPAAMGRVQPGDVPDAAERPAVVLRGRQPILE